LLYLVTLATIGYAHKPRIYDIHFAPYAEAPTFERLVALGESYHNAWKQCHQKTTEWLFNDLGLDDVDPTFDNSYYIEYSIKSRVPETYNLFREFLGADNYWEAPEFNGDGHVIRWGELVTAQTATDGDDVDEDENGDWDEYDQGKWWIEEHNHPTQRGEDAITYDPNNVDNDTKRKLKNLFYNIQQTSYYCDFTLESGMFSAKKFFKLDLAETINNERASQKEIWGFILRKEVAPVRWALKLWTRYNIAEPAIRKVIDHFNEDWEIAIDAVESLEYLRDESDYNTKLAIYKDMKDTWVEEFEAWIDSCYDERRPDDDVIETASDVCHDGITWEQLKRGKAQSKAMWYEFFEPLLHDYQSSDGYDVEVHNAAFNDIWDSVMALGEPHSFRCEFIWIITRVRYFEIVPTWELQRIHDDTQDKWEEIKDHRQQLIDFGRDGDLFSEETLIDMKRRKDNIREFLGKWINAEDEVFDADGELHRNTLRRLTKEHADEAFEIYKWHFQMGLTSIEKKDDEAELDWSSEKTNHKWTDQTRLANSIVTSHSRLGFRKWVWRELIKLHFHTWRRI
jgi:hypothetical protein